jgi:hypothetical protein
MQPGAGCQVGQLTLEPDPARSRSSIGLGIDGGRSATVSAAEPGDVVRVGDLDELPAVHHRHAVADVPHGREACEMKR